MEVPVLDIGENIYIVGLGVLVKDISSLVVADFHIGYEEALESQGVHVPALQYPVILRLLRSMIKKSKAERLIILGDVKHEFGEALRQEWRETVDLFTEVKNEGVEVYVIRGNHDNFLIPILKKLEIPLYDPYLRIDNYLFIHGHKSLPIDAILGEITHVFMGHEHPAVVLRDELGIKVKFKCLLKGLFEGKELIILPALSPLMPGTEVNVEDKKKFLSPILSSVDIESFRVYVIDLSAGIYDFGSLGALRYALQAV